MKGILAAVALLGYLCCTTALPATSKQIDDDVELIPHKEIHVQQPVISTDFGFDSFSNPFGDLFDNFESMLSTIRKQIDQLMNRFPGIRPGNSSGEFPDFSNFGGDLSPFPQFDDIDLTKGNTTSEIKIIDGHKVVINQTEYHKEGDNGSAFFQVRIIDVKPQDFNTEKIPEGTTGSTVAVTKDREVVENSIENEIDKNKEAVYYQPLELDELDSGSKLQPPSLSYLTDNSEWNDLNKIEPIDDNALNFNENRPIDLNRDTYVNELLAKSGATMNPDAEIIKPVRVSTGNPQPLISTGRPWINDLSRDTYVNDILAKAGATTNADAEMIETTPKASTEGPMVIRFQPKR